MYGGDLKMQRFEFNTTKCIISEAGSLKRINDLCASLNVTKPMIITDQGIVMCGLLSQLTQLMSSQYELIIYDTIESDPKEKIILDALKIAQQDNVDGIIGFGGGSSMDAAKVVAVLASSNQSIQSIYGTGQITGNRLPLILIPTTAGTGSEVTPIAIVTTGETTKAGIVSPKLLPDIALLDAELTIGLPAHITATTGIDAMVHAIEAYTSKIKKNPYSDMIAKEALRLLSNNIEIACDGGSNLEARQNMLLGACLAGQAFANAPVAAVHALAYPLGGHFHIPHGLSNSLVLPHVMRFNAQSCASLYRELTPYICPDVDTSQTDESVAKALINAIEQLIMRLSLPATLKDMDIKLEQLSMLAKDAMLQQRLLVNNPRELDYKDALNIYQSAFGEI